jgi:hypothetical protein
MKKEGTDMVTTWSPVADQGTGEQAGVFIIRIWNEPGSSSGFRARIIKTLDLSSPHEVVRAASSVQDICDAVEKWIGEFVSSEEG